jgi:prefoldin subunit 5
MQDQYSAMECAVEEKEEVIKELNREIFTLNNELEALRQKLLELSAQNEMLEGNLQANQVITL